MLRLSISQILARRRRIGDVVVAAVCQRHIASTQFVIGGEQREVFPDDISVLDPDGGDALAALVDPDDVSSRVCEFDPVGVHLVGHAMDGVEFRHRIFFGLPVVRRRPLRLAHVHDEEADIELAFLHFRDVDLSVSAHTRIDFVGGKVEGNVVVRIDGQNTGVNLRRQRADFLVRHLSRTGKQQRERHERSGRLRKETRHW